MLDGLYYIEFENEMGSYSVSKLLSQCRSDWFEIFRAKALEKGCGLRKLSDARETAGLPRDQIIDVTDGKVGMWQGKTPGA